MRMLGIMMLLIGVLAVLASSGCMSKGSEKNPVKMDINLIINHETPIIVILLYDENGNPTTTNGVMSVSILKGHYSGEYDAAYQPIWNGKVNLTKGQFSWITLGHNGYSKDFLAYEMNVPDINPQVGDLYRITATVYPEVGQNYSVGNWTNIVWA